MNSLTEICSHGPPPGTPPRNSYPGQQYHQQHPHGGGYPGQRAPPPFVTLSQALLSSETFVPLGQTNTVLMLRPVCLITSYASKYLYIWSQRARHTCLLLNSNITVLNSKAQINNKYSPSSSTLNVQEIRRLYVHVFHLST
jgi:hypothetical protein